MSGKKGKHTLPIEIESEKSFQLFLDTLAYPSVIHTGGKVMYGNKAAAKLFKFRSPKDLVSKNTLEFIHPDYRKLTGQRIKEVYEKGFTKEKENRVIDSKGAVLVVKISGTLINYKGEPSVLATIQNITEEHGFEEQLKASELEYRQVLENINEGIIKFNLKEEITYVNRRFCKMTGYSAKELIGKVAHDLLISTEDSKQIVRNAIKDRKRGESSKYEIQLLTKTKKLIWVSVNGTPIFDEAGKHEGSLGVVRDISDSKKAQLALEQSESRLRSLFENANDLVQSVGPDGRFLFVNKAWLKTLGYKVSDLKKLSMFKILHPDSLKHCMLIFAQVLQGKSVGEIETTFVKKNGGKVHVHGNITLHKTVNGEMMTQGIFSDVTEDKRTALDLKKSEEKFRSLVEKMNEGIIMVDNDEIIEYVNQRYCQLVGFKYKELMGKNALEVMVHDKTSMDKIKKMVPIRRRGVSSKYEVRFKRKNGAWIDASMSGTPLYNEDGTVRGSMGIVTDITDQKRFEGEIQVLNQGLEQRVEERTSQLEKANTEITVLLREMHHRVKNNLQIVSSLLNMQAASVDDEFVAHAFRESQDRIQTMAFIHESLYLNESMSEISVTKYLGPLVQDRIRANADLFNKIDLDTDFLDVNFEIDTMLPIGLLLNELVTNSLKHAFPGKQSGRITVKLVKRPKGHIALLYSDDGIGFPISKPNATPGSMGLILIETFAMQLDGKMKRLPGPGTNYEFSFKPL